MATRLPSGGFRDCGILDIAFASDDTVWVANGFSVARSSNMSGPRADAGSAVDDQSWTRYEMLINSLVAGPDGSIWMNGWEGLQGSGYVARFLDGTSDGEHWTIYKTADSFPGVFAVAAVTDDGRVWDVVPERGLASFAYRLDSTGTDPATGEGAAWAESESWEFHQPPDDVFVESLIGLAPDGSLWLKTQDGIARYDPSVGPTSGGESALDAWTVYAEDAGPVMYYGAVAFGPRDEVWFGTTRFQPEEDDTP